MVRINYGDFLSHWKSVIRIPLRQNRKAKHSVAYQCHCNSVMDYHRVFQSNRCSNFLHRINDWKSSDWNHNWNGHHANNYVLLGSMSSEDKGSNDCNVNPIFYLFWKPCCLCSGIFVSCTLTVMLKSYSVSKFTFDNLE